MADASYDTIVFKYGIPGPLPAETLDPLVAQIRLAHNLRNDLTEVERNHADRVAEVWSRHPDIKNAQEELEQAQAQAEEALQAVKKDRQRSRSSKAQPASEAALTEAAARSKEARKRLKAAKEMYYAQFKEQMEEAGKVKQAEVKALYGVYTERGLYWASINDVIAHHKTRVKKVQDARKQGRPADYKFLAWDGTGTIAIQPQRQNSDPPRSPWLLAEGGGKWRNVFQLSPWVDPNEWGALKHSEQRRQGLGYAMARIGAGDSEQLLRIPVRVHRMMPLAADVALVRITRRRIGNDFRMHMSVTARIPKPAPRTEGPLAAIHLGWRLLGDGSIRVALACGMKVPERSDLRELGVIRPSTGGYEVIIPPSWKFVHDRPGHLHGQRDTNLLALRKWLREYLERYPQAAEQLCTPADVAQHSSQRFYALAVERLRYARSTDGLPDYLEGAFQHMAAWLKQDDHLLAWEANERDQIIGRRNHAWAVLAACLTDEAAAVVIDEWQIAPLARRPQPGDEDAAIQPAASANRVLAAPGRLREQVVKAAARRGVQVMVPGDDLPRGHHKCGRPLSGERDREIMMWCQECGVMVDQDHNRLMNMVEWAKGKRDAPVPA